MAAIDPKARSINARIASHVRWANEPDRTEATRPGREAFLARFEREVDPNRVLPESERIRRAEAARTAYMLKLGKKAVAARKAKREAAA